MESSHRSFRGIVAAFVTLAALALLWSCATAELVAFGEDGLGTGGGWVTFIRDNVTVYVTRMTGGTESSPLKLAQGNVPAAIPCAAGRNEFVVYDGSGEVARLEVPVTEGAVTFVGMRQIVLEWQWRWTPSGWTVKPVRYLVRCSVGSHPLPADKSAKDPQPYFSALEDGDWATRLIAVGNLERINPPLNERQWSLLATMSREESSAPVYLAAGQFFRRTRNPAPDPPIVAAWLDRYVYGLSLESDDRIARSLVTDGYRMDSKLDRQSYWQMLRSSSITGWKDLEYALECSWEEGSQTGAFGLTVGYDVNNFNAFCVSKSGGAAVLAYRGGSLQTTPISWTNDLADVIASSPVIRIGVSKRGTDYTMTVNGTPVGTFADKDIRSGLVGMFVNGRQAVVFRKIVVYRPPKPFTGSR